MDKEQRKHGIPMAKQDVLDRIHNFYEVALGYTKEQAMLEAERCLQCPNPRCVQGCPVDIDIPAFIQDIKEGNFLASSAKIKEKNSLPAVCGRVCPQENQCQQMCVLGKMGDPISIGRLERFASDYERKMGVNIPEHEKASVTGKVAIVGSGPAGLTVAADLVKQGHQVVMFESLHLAGGVLMYGIPEFRLPKEIVQAEVQYIKELGVDVKTNYTIGRIFTIDELFADGFDAVFVGSGAGLPRFMRIPGENLGGVYSANEFLIRVNLMKGAGASPGIVLHVDAARPRGIPFVRLAGDRPSYAGELQIDLVRREPRGRGHGHRDDLVVVDVDGIARARAVAIAYIETLDGRLAVAAHLRPRRRHERGQQGHRPEDC